MINEKNVKLVKTCRTTRNIVRVIRIFSYVALALVLLVAAAVAVPDFIDMKDMVVEHNMTGTEIVWGKDQILAVLGAAMGTIVIASLVLWQCEKVLGTVTEDGSPFVEENVARIKSIAVLTAMGSVLPSFVAQMVRLISAMINKNGVEMMLEVNVDYLVIALVIWCVALIFEYGVTLQQRDDETL